MRQSREQHVMRAAPRAFVGVAPSLGRPISGLSRLRLNDVLGKKKRALEFLLLLSRLQPPYMGKPYLRLCIWREPTTVVSAIRFENRSQTTRWVLPGEPSWRRSVSQPGHVGRPSAC